MSASLLQLLHLLTQWSQVHVCISSPTPSSIDPVIPGPCLHLFSNSFIYWPSDPRTMSILLLNCVSSFSLLFFYLISCVPLCWIDSFSESTKLPLLPHLILTVTSVLLLQTTSSIALLYVCVIFYDTVYQFAFWLFLPSQSDSILDPLYFFLI